MIGCDDDGADGGGDVTRRRTGGDEARHQTQQQSLGSLRRRNGHELSLILVPPLLVTAVDGTETDVLLLLPSLAGGHDDAVNDDALILGDGESQEFPTALEGDCYVVLRDYCDDGDDGVAPGTAHDDDGDGDDIDSAQRWLWVL